MHNVKSNTRKAIVRTFVETCVSSPLGPSLARPKSESFGLKFSSSRIFADLKSRYITYTNARAKNDLNKLKWRYGLIFVYATITIDFIPTLPHICIWNSLSPPLVDIVLFGLFLFELSLKIFKMRLLGRGFHTLIKNVLFHSPADVGSHNPPPFETQHPR